MTALEHIAEYLHRRCGFAVTESSLAALRHAVDRRVEETGTGNVPDYETFLTRSADELKELVEATIVSETFFFRYPESFAALRSWVAAQTKRPIRILSLACATGEEPYSIAMSLLDEGLSPRDFVIEAADISEQAIHVARRGLYREKSFRSGDAEWRARYFARGNGGWEISDEVKSAVQFRQGNLLDLNDHAAWEVIFCRNVLIYFSGSQREKVMHLLDRSLARGGLLFLGPAEPAVFLEHGWKLAGYAMSFACVKADQITSSPGVARRPAPARPLSKPSVRERREPSRPAAARPPAVEEPSHESEVERARLLANAGDLDEADALLARILREEPENPEGHFLVGLVQEVRGHLTSAETSYRKALFLDSTHIEALQHMTLLLRNQGRAAAAEQLARRAGRHAAS